MPYVRMGFADSTTFRTNGTYNPLTCPPGFNWSGSECVETLEDLPTGIAGWINQNPLLAGALLVLLIVTLTRGGRR